MDTLTTIGIVAWELRKIKSEDEFWEHLADILRDARHQQWIVLPELFILELASLQPGMSQSKLVPFLVQFAGRFEAALSRAAQDFSSIIVGGSHFRSIQGRPVHVSATFYPSGEKTFQPKNVLTQFELKEWLLTPMTGMTRQLDPRLGVAVCYDSEFPGSGRSLAEIGMCALAVPAFTETAHGYHRVRTGCMARALENQIYVAHASLVGGLGAEPAPTAYGNAALYGPSVLAFPASGVIAESPMNQEAVLKTELNFDLILRCRETDDVRNWNDRNKSDWRVTSSPQ